MESVTSNPPFDNPEEEPLTATEFIEEEIEAEDEFEGFGPSSTEVIEFSAPRSFPLQRIDKVLAELAPHLSRSRIQALIEEGAVSVNGRPATTPSAKLHPHQTIALVLPPARESTITPENAPVDFLFQDDHVAVINKPAGLPVHPGAGRPAGTLLNRLVALPGFNQGVGGVDRPGIVHRLDMDTTGVMIVAKTDAAYSALRAQLDDRSLGRRYLALAWRPFSDPMATITAPVGRHPQQRMKMAVRPSGQGRSATTHFRIIEPYGPLSLVECVLETGRTHQIRVHLAHIGHPVANDALYGGAFERMGELLPQTWRAVRTALLRAPRQLLHAWQIQFVHPATQETMRFQAPPPKDFLDVVEALQSSVARPQS